MAASPPRSIMELGLQRTGDDNLHRIVRARAMLAAAQRSAAMPVGRSGTSPTKVPKQYNKRGAPLTHCWSLAPNLFYIYIIIYIYVHMPTDLQKIEFFLCCDLQAWLRCQRRWWNPCLFSMSKGRLYVMGLGRWILEENHRYPLVN